MKPKYPRPKEEGAIFLSTIKGYDTYFLSGKRPAIISIGPKGERLNAYCKYIELGQALYIQHRALAKAKELHLYQNHLEESLLPPESKDLYLVEGVCGVGMDIRTWIVRAFRDKGSAETYAKACEAVAKNWTHEYHDPPYNWSLLDPSMKSDEGETHYAVWTIPIALRQEEINSSNQICPICHQQVYVTSQGKVCEQGHEVF